MYKLGLIGYPLGHSLSAVIQKAGFESIGEQGSYEILETPPAELVDRVKYLKINDYNKKGTPRALAVVPLRTTWSSHSTRHRRFP